MIFKNLLSRDFCPATKFCLTRVIIVVSILSFYFYFYDEFQIFLTGLSLSFSTFLQDFL